MVNLQIPTLIYSPLLMALEYLCWVILSNNALTFMSKANGIREDQWPLKMVNKMKGVVRWIVVVFFNPLAYQESSESRSKEIKQRLSSEISAGDQQEFDTLYSQFDFRRMLRFGFFALTSSPFVALFYLRILPYVARLPKSLNKQNKAIFFKELGLKIFHDYCIFCST